MDFVKNLQNNYLMLKKQTIVGALYINLFLTNLIVTYFNYLKTYLYLLSQKTTTTCTWLDLILTKKNIIFLKNGANLDSIVKITFISMLTQMLSTVIVILDKFIITFLVKKNIETIYTNLIPVFSKMRRSSTSIFLAF